MNTLQNRPPTEVKADIRKQFTLLREVCSKANNWHEIQPVIDKFDGSLPEPLRELRANVVDGNERPAVESRTPRLWSDPEAGRFFLPDKMSGFMSA